MARKLIQLCALTVRVGEVSKDSLYGLSDDGTVWVRDAEILDWINCGKIPSDIEEADLQEQRTDS